MASTSSGNRPRNNEVAINGRGRIYKGTYTVSKGLVTVYYGEGGYESIQLGGMQEDSAAKLLLQSLVYKNFRRKAEVYIRELRVELEKFDLSDADKSTINEVLDTVATRINSWTVWGTEESDISELLLSLPDMNSIQTIKKKLIELF